MDLENAKEAAARAAVDLIPAHSVVGLGTGTTAAHFIKALVNKPVKAVVASSMQSADLAQKLGLPLRDLNEILQIDITVDGADEIDSMKRAIKGGGGAHVRERILISASKEWIVIVDETKLVKSVGHTKLPVEIFSFGALATEARIRTLGFTGKWRHRPDGSPMISDNGNPLFDIVFQAPPSHPEAIHEELRHLSGVVDTGFFFNLAGRVIVGTREGQARVM